MKLEGFDAPGFGNNYFQPQQRTVVQPPKKKKNFLESLIPAIGGTGGAVGGAALGTALLPGVGTLAGALLGGALGGGAGKVGENALEHQNLTSGVAGQAALNGVLGAGPLRLAKFGVTAARGIAGEGDLAGALLNAGQKATGPGIISTARSTVANKGAQFEARSAGIGVGEKLSRGSEGIGSQDSKDLLNILKKEGVKPGTPESRQSQVEQLLQQRGKQLTSHIANNNVSITAPARKSITTEFSTSIENRAGVNDLVRKSATNLISNFNKQVKDAKSLVDFRRQLDKDVIAFNRTPEGKTAPDQIAANAFRAILKKQENTLIPGVKSLNTSFSNLTKLNAALKDASKKISNQGEGGGSIFNRVVGSDTSQALKSRGGALAQKAAPKSGFNAFSTKNVAKRVLPVNIAANLNTSTSQPGGSLSTALTQSSGLDSNSQPTIAPQQSPYPLQNALADIQRDPKNEDYYMKLYQLANPQPQSISPGYSKPTAQVHSQATSALQSIDQLEQLLNQNPSLVNKSAVPGQGLPIIGSLESGALGTSNYKALSHNILNSVARINTGANMPESEEKFYNQTYLPQPGDPPQTVAQKLQTLRSFFEPIVNYPGSSDSSGDLTSAILAQLGQ